MSTKKTYTFKEVLRVERIMIIALDGLEPSLVTDAMPNLLQREHGTVEVDIFPLQTPLIWATFLTGAKENGVQTMTAPHRFQEKISAVFGYNNVARISSFASESGLYDLSPFSKYMKQYTKDDLTKPTIFDLADKHVALDIPGYNENPVYVKIRRTIASVISDQYPEEDLVSEVWGLFQMEYEACLRLLESDWDLFMAHFFVTDVIGHLCWDNVERVKECYRVMDERIGEVKRRVDDAVVLVVSDHGMQSGLHTHEGFYSLNKHLNLDSPKITDFYDIIGRILLEGKERAGITRGKERVLKHLRELGYF